MTDTFATVVAAIALAGGVLVLLAGRKLLRASLAIVGFLVGGVVGGLGGLLLAGPPGALAGGVAGGMVGIALGLVLLAFAAVVAGAAAGWAAGTLVGAAIGLGAAAGWLGLVLAVVGGVLGAVLREPVVVVGTAVFGGFVVATSAVALVAPGIGLREDVARFETVTALALAVLGVVVQLRSRAR